MSHSRQNKSLSKCQTRKIIQDFCEATSLHGYSYLYQADTIFLKFAWTLAILSLSGLGTLFLGRNINDYMKAGLINNIESTTANLGVCISSSNNIQN